MRKTLLEREIGLVLIGVIIVSLVSWNALARAGAAPSPSSLVEEVRRATRAFQDVAAARAAGSGQVLGCVSGPQEGAMGVHFVNGDLVADGVLDVKRPEALMYETKGGRHHLVGVEYIVLADAWHARSQTPPALMGQSFHYTGSPNRYGIPAFYALHVWAWKLNPHGMFVDWNPGGSCEEHRDTAAAPGGR